MWGDAAPLEAVELAQAEADGASWDPREELRERQKSTSEVMAALRKDSYKDLAGLEAAERARAEQAERERASHQATVDAC